MIMNNIHYHKIVAIDCHASTSLAMTLLAWLRAWPAICFLQ